MPPLLYTLSVMVGVLSLLQVLALLYSQLQAPWHGYEYDGFNSTSGEAYGIWQTCSWDPIGNGFGCRVNQNPGNVFSIPSGFYDIIPNPEGGNGSSLIVRRGTVCHDASAHLSRAKGNRALTVVATLFEIFSLLSCLIFFCCVRFDMKVLVLTTLAVETGFGFLFTIIALALNVTYFTRFVTCDQNLCDVVTVNGGRNCVEKWYSTSFIFFIGVILSLFTFVVSIVLCFMGRKLLKNATKATAGISPGGRSRQMNPEISGKYTARGADDPELAVRGEEINQNIIQMGRSGDNNASDNGGARGGGNSAAAPPKIGVNDFSAISVGPPEGVYNGPPDDFEPPEGDWIWDPNSYMYWSNAEYLFLNPANGHFYDPNSNYWYDPETEKWYPPEQQSQ